MQQNHGSLVVSASPRWESTRNARSSNSVPQPLARVLPECLRVSRFRCIVAAALAVSPTASEKYSSVAQTTETPRHRPYIATPCHQSNCTPSPRQKLLMCSPTMSARLILSATICQHRPMLQACTCGAVCYASRRPDLWCWCALSFISVGSNRPQALVGCVLCGLAVCLGMS